MGRKAKKTIDDMIAEIESAAKEAFYHLAKDVVDDMQICYDKAIDAFYKDYRPRKYKRTYSLYQATSTYAPCYETGNYANVIIPKKYDKGISYTCTMEIDSKYIKGNPYAQGHKNPENIPQVDWIFKRSFNNFIHGFTPTENEKWVAPYMAHRPQISARESRWIPVGNPPKPGEYEYSSSRGNTMTHSSLYYIVSGGISQVRQNLEIGNRFYEYFDESMSRIK